jgi:hypothetical protein
MKTTVEPIAPGAFASAAPDTRTAGFASKRMARESKTMAVMVAIHCRRHHGSGAMLCLECRGLLDYANARLGSCRFGPAKPTCAKCPVHCYQPRRREQIRAAMRYAGPRMVWKHPVMSLRHWLDG